MNQKKMVRREETLREQWRNNKLKKNITECIGTSAERRYWGEERDQQERDGERKKDD